MPHLSDYPGRPELVGAMLPMLKAARRPLSPEWERFGLEADGWHQLDLLANRLTRHQHFEHLGRKSVRDSLHQGALRYQGIAAATRSQPESMQLRFLMRCPKCRCAGPARRTPLHHARAIPQSS